MARLMDDVSSEMKQDLSQVDAQLGTEGSDILNERGLRLLIEEYSPLF